MIDDLQNQIDEKVIEYELPKGIEINQGKQEISIGQKVDLTHSSKLTVLWTSSDSSIATVNNITGRVTIVGTEISDTVQVVVKGDILYCYYWDYEQGMSPNWVDDDDFCSNARSIKE